MFALLNKSIERARHHHLVDNLLDRHHARAQRRRSGLQLPPQRRKILFESLEPRLLMSADLLPGAVQGAQNPDAPVNVQVTPPSPNTPQINWTAPLTTGDAPLYASSMVSSFDPDNFSSPLAPVAPGGDLVYAGRVQGTLDFDTDSDTLTIALDGNQSFTLRLKPPAGLQARIEAFDPDGNTLGFLEATNAGDTLVLQLRSAANTGDYSVKVDSLAGVGTYTVEIFLNAALEESDSTDAGTALNLDGVFSALLDSGASRAAMLGSLSAVLPTRAVAEEDFQDGNAFNDKLNNGIWALSTTNPDASVVRTAYGEGSEAYLAMRADQSGDYSTIEVDNGEGGTYLQDQYTYHASLDQATWRLNLAGVTQATLDFDRWGYDPNGDYAPAEDFFGSANFDGVSISTDGDYWIVLQEFGSDYGYGVSHSMIDLVQAATAHGLTLGSDTRIRFQFYDAGGTFNNTQAYYRNFDNIRVTTDQQQILLTPAGVSSLGTEGSEYVNNLALLTDGLVPVEGTDYYANSNVYWSGQEVLLVPNATGAELAPSAGVLSGLYFDLDLGSTQRVAALLLSVDNNDDYAVDSSLDGANWSRLVDVLASSGNAGYGMDTLRYTSADQPNGADGSFTAVQAHYLRFYATSGDGNYAIGELQAFTNAAVDPADWYSLSLVEGELATFTLSLENTGDNAGMQLDLYDQDQNLVTSGLLVGGPVSHSIQNFRAPATGTYTVRVSGNTTGDYNLVAVKQANFGAGTTATQDLTLTPIMLDALSGSSGSSANIRVAVLGGGNVTNQLNDDTYFNFSATNVEYYNIDTVEELNNFDVVVIGASQDKSAFNLLAPVLRPWVEAGHGLVASGWSVYYAGASSGGGVNADIDAIVPVNLNGNYEYNYYPTVHITNNGHPVTAGVTDFSGSGSYVEWSSAGVDVGATVLGTTDGNATIVVGQPGAGRSVYLGPVYPYYNWSSGMADRLLEQAVAWAGPSGNQYTVQARAGTDLTVTLDLLGADAEQPLNDLAPVLELYNSSGTLLASGTTIASYSVLDDASFTIKVSGAGSGDYLLRVSGDIPAVATSLQVVSSTLDGVDALINFPNQVDIRFSQPVLYTSLDAADLLVNGVAAESFSILSPTQVRFNFANTFDGDGSYLVELPEGSVTDIHGNANQAWAHAFSIDTHGPTVVATSVLQGATLEPGVQTFTFTLSETLATADLAIGDVQLRETLTNQLVNITGFNYNGTDTVTVTTASLGEGAYQLTLFSGFYGFKDVIGNYLDGDADGVAGGNFTLGFSVDVGTLAYPAVQGLPPAGSLVYDPLVHGVVHAAGDVDTYTVNLDAGQTLSVLVSSVAPGLQIEIAVLDADDDSQVALVTGAAGETVALQALTGLSGNYKVEVRGLAGSGSYAFSLILNALLEQEMLVGTVGNDSIGTAQDIAPSSLDLGFGGSRMAVVGDRFAATNLDDDVYRIHLGAGQLASVGLAWTHNASGELLLDLVRADGTVLAIGANDAGNAQQAIRAFVATDDADYYLRVHGNAEGTYNLVVTRSMSFSLPSTQAGVPGQDISLTGQVLGAIGGASGSVGSGTGVATNLGLNLFDASGFRWDIQRDGDIGDGTNDAYDGGMVHTGFPSFSTGLLEDGGREVVMGPATIGGVQVSRKIYVPADQSFARFLEVITNTTGATVNYTVPIYTNLGSDGGENFVQTSSGDSTTNTADNWLITDDNSAGTSGGDPVVTHVVAGDSGRVRPASFVKGSGAVNYSYNLSLAPGQTQIVMHFASQAANQPTAVARAPVLTALGLGALNGLTSAEKSAVVNFNIGTSDFLLQVNVNDVLEISTLTPGDGAGEPSNTLDPSVELLAPNGSVVASNTNGAADGRNANLSYTALASGTYTVRVLSESGTGDFVLRAAGATGVQPPLTVTSASITEGQVFNTPPTAVDVNFSHALRADSVQAGDLSVNGQAAVGVIQIDADTLRFDISGLVGADGSYTLSIQDSAVSSLTGSALVAFSRSFVSDGTRPTVIAESVAEGEVIGSGPRTLVFTLSEDLATAGLSAEDVLLSNAATGVSYSPASFVYSASTDQITLQYASLPEGPYTLTLLSGANSLRDLVGNALNGNTATPEADNYVLHFNVDVPTASLPALSALAPLGSLAYRAEAAGRAVHGAGDVDAFTVSLDAGQTLTLWANQTAGAARLAIELFSAETGGASLGLTEATTLGQTVLLQTLAIGGGTYRVEVRSLEGAGQYTLKALLNAAVETELAGGTDNNTLANAQDLTGSFITTGSDRAAVVGQSTTGADDWYSVHLNEGQIASFVLTPEAGLGATDLWLGLYNAAGVLLTAGGDIATNVDEAINDFHATQAGDYFLRVTGNSSGLYSLVATRDQGFSLELKDAVQDLSPTGEVLGALGSGGGSGNGLIAVVSAPANNEGLQAIVNQLNDHSFTSNNAVLVSIADVDTLAELSQYSAVVIGGTGNYGNQFSGFATNLRAYVEAGGGLLVTGWGIYASGGLTGQTDIDFDAIVPVNTNSYNYFSSPTVNPVSGHPITEGVTSFGGFDFSEYPGSSPSVDVGATILATVGGTPVAAAMTVGNGRSVYLGPIYAGTGSYSIGSLRSGEADQLLEQAAAWVGGDSEDNYHLQVTTGDALRIRTSTPGDGGGAPSNLLDLRVELHDETGAMVAGSSSGALGDARNVDFNYTTLSAGTYTVRVLAENNAGRGEYVLSVTGSTSTTNPAPVVIQSSPPDGKRLGSAPTTLTLDLDNTVLASSLGVDDLVLDSGASVTGVEMVDGDTVRFTLDVPSAEGTYHYELLANAFTSLQGVGSLAHAGSFFIDTTAPRVASQNPEVQSISPFNTWSVTFNEAVDPATVQTGDFVLKNPNNGTIGISSATVSNDGLTVTLAFADQFTQGNYTLTAGPNINDIAGNLMDQDNATTGNQTYLGTVQVASPDLNPEAISLTLPDGNPIPEAGAMLGSQVKVSWTVRNIGTDAARSSAWYDSIWLSTDTNPSNDILLGSFLVTNTNGLAAGGQYSLSANVTLPLNDNVLASSYYLRVQVDNYNGYGNNQPENNETNNALYSAVFATSVPPLPDLTVSNVAAPAVIEAGKNITVSWTVNNLGGAAATSPYGYWHDGVVLSTDQVYGNGDDVLLSDSYYYASIPAADSLNRSVTVNVPANRTGTWNVLVKTDVYNYVYERGNEGNNVGVGAAQVQVVVPTEDLTPIALTAPDAALFGSTIEASWTVRNAGTGTTYGDWYDRVWLSTDAILDNNDTALNYVYASNTPDVRPVSAGGEYTRNIQNLQLPLSVALTNGTYYLLLKTDAGNQEPELDEANNVIARAITLTLADYPDLTISDVQVPDSVRSGDTFTVSFNVNNTGDAAAANFHNYIYLSQDGTTLNEYVGDYFLDQSLAAGASVPVSKSIAVPLYSPGNWYVVVVADAHGNIYEHANEGNNRAVSATLVTATLPPLPDLVVSDMLAPLQGLAGDAITFSWTITNQGAADFTGTWHDHVFLTNDIGQATQDYGYFSFEGSLAAGASVTRTQNLSLSPTQDGNRRFVVVTDAYSQVNETPLGQNNNTAYDNTLLAITFPPLPNLQVTDIDPPVEPFSGTQTTISWEVTNTGTGATSASAWYDQVLMSLDDNWETTEDNIVLATVVNPNYLPAGANNSYRNSATISIPRGLNADYHFLVRTDIYNQVFENDFEGDNTRVSDVVLVSLTPPPDLRVDMVEAPNEEFSGTPMTLTWTVSNHGDGPTAENLWYDRVIMSLNDTLGDADDRRLGDFQHLGRLPRFDPDGTGDSYTVSHTVDLPIGVVGEYHFFVITDVANHVYEHGSEGNNSAQDQKSDGTGPEATTILLTPPPDLEVFSVSVPGSVEAGHTYNASWRVVNFGSTPTPNSSWTDRLYLSTDGTLDGGDIFLRDIGHSGALGVADFDDNGDPTSGYYDTTASFTLPFDISGSYQLIVKTDIANQVFEGFDNPTGPDSEDNNDWASNTMTVANRPADLVVESLVAPATGEAGKQITLTWTVSNIGSGDSIANNWLDQIRVSSDDILYDDDDIALENVYHSGVLNANGSYTRSQTVTLPFSLTGGSYRMYVLTDVFGRVTESREDNNTAFATIQVLRDTPDLQVTQLAHEAEGMVALPLDVSWRVDNLGENQTDVSNWYDDVFLSLDGVLDNNDTYLGLRYRNASLVAGAGYEASGSFTLPTTLAPNDYFVILRTDRNNSVTEGAAGEANNVRVSDDKVHVVAFDPNNPDGVLPFDLLRPDLRVSAVDAPASAISGQIMQVTWTVVNDGADPTGNRNWYDAVYLSRDGVLDRNADLYLGYAYQSNLAAGASYTQSLDVRVPYGQSGPFYLFVATDAGRYITEANELNNVGQDASFTQVALAPPADLVVGDIDIPANGVPGQSATIQFSVTNQGTNPALGSWTDSVYLSTDDTWDINDALFGTVTHYGDVAGGGASYSSSLTATLPGLTPGSYRVIVRSDIRNHIPESNEANNIKGTLDSVALDVEALAFTLGVATDSGNLAAGQAVYYKFDVAAGETVRLSLDSAGDGVNANELYVRFGNMPTRGQFDVAARDGFVSDPNLLIPTTQAGTYYVLAYGQSVEGNPPYTIKAEIIPFSITDINATEVGNSGNVTLRIEGAKFGGNTEFSLVAPDGTVIQAQAVFLDNSSEAYATFNLLGADIGKYDVVAQQVNTLVDGTRVVLATTTRVDALNVAEDMEAAVFMSIAGPTDVMVNRTAIFTLNYVNEGGADSVAPLMVVESFSATPMGLSASDLHTSPLYIMAGSFDGPMDILRPGARYSVPIVFKSGPAAGNLDIRVGRILATDTRLITDWDAIETGARPTGVGNAEWDAFWGRVQPLIGLTLGEYVQVLNRMMLLVSEPGHPVRDVRDLFARMLQLNPDFVPCNSMGGEVRDSETNTGLADIQMAAYLVHPDGSLEYKASALSDADGHFNFARLAPGDYSVVAIGRALDMDRNGQVDLTVPETTLGHTTPGSAGIIYIQPAAGIGASSDSNPALNRDANGITHMVWSREGLVWHAWFDNTSGKWKDAQAISAEESYGPTIASSDKLFDGAKAGTIVAWQQGKGNDSEIWYAVARAKAGGGFEWSAPRQLTDDGKMDMAPQIIVGDNGLVMFTFLKRDGAIDSNGIAIQDDTDIYYEIWAFGEAEFMWPAETTVAEADVAATDAPLTTEGASVAFGRQWKFGPWDVFGTSAELQLALTGQVAENNCKATLGAKGQIQGSFKGSNIRTVIAGNGSVTAEWGVNQAAKDWMFNGAKASVGATVRFDWRYGLSTLLSKIPHPAVTAAHLAYSLAVGLAARLGLDFEDGITFGGGVNFGLLEWKLIQPFPDFVRPDGIFTADLSGTFGLYAQLKVGPTGDSARLQGDLTVTLGIEPVFKIKSITGNITFSGNIGIIAFNEVFSVTLYNNSDTEVLAADAQPNQVLIPLFDADALIGTGNAYGTNHLLADVSTDVTADSAVSLAKDDGVIFGAWTHMAETRSNAAGWQGQLGWDVMVADFGGVSWDAPVKLPDSFGVNSNAIAAVDGNGKRMVIWTHASSSLLGTAPTANDYEAALDAAEVVYATYDDVSHTWSTLHNVATTLGMDTGLNITHDATGQLVLSWVYTDADNFDRLLTANWSGSSWSLPVVIGTGASVIDPAMERLGNNLIVVWETDANPAPEETEKSLFYSIYNGASWSAGAMFDPIAMATGMALSAGLPAATTADADLTTLSGFPPFPVPEECLKCKPEEIKRIRESAPNCIDGGGTKVTFDDKTCTEKTIVYKPCVVRPRDPNDIIGPEGYGEEDWISSKSTMGYMIRFENAADATAPAQQVVVTQQLDDDLDWRTLRIDDFGFGDQIIELDGKGAFYQKRLDFTADPTRGYFLDVSAAVNVTTGIVTWTMTTIDPATGDLPQNGQVGFLPVNDTVYNANHDVVVQGTGRGEGYVTYTVRALRTATTGTVIDAQARIVFDTEEPIDTPAIANTLDAGVPTSQMIAFATSTTPSGEFLVQWGGEDDATGSGLRDFSIYLSIDGGVFEIWLPDTALTEAIYLGSEGHSYSFYSTVRDWAGNEEREPLVADASITVSGATGSISGTKFEDYDGDGVRDDGEAGLSGWTVFLDTDLDGILDAGEVSTVTGLDGGYSFIDLNPGAYTVAEVLQAGWVQTLPDENSQTANVVSGENTQGVDFGNFQLAQIGGQKINDLNANGTLDEGEEGLAGWTIQLDRDGNGSIDATTTTDQYGFYRFTGVGTGSYTVSEVQQSGWLQTGPAAGNYTVVTTSGADIGSLDFANVQAASISGTKFEDLDGDGQRDAGEQGLAGWTIFLDKNGNGGLDAGEQSTLTDAQGAYGFANLLPGEYVVAEVMQAGWVQTSPGAGPSSTSLTLTGMDVALSLPEDVVLEGSISTQAASANDLADTLVGLDAFRADSRFTGIDGSGVTTVVIDTGIDLNHSWFGPDLDLNGVADRIVYSYDFADSDIDASDLNGHGSHVASLVGGQDTTYGGVAQGADLIALKVFGDDGAGYFSYLEAALQWVVANADTYDIGVVNLSLGDGGNWGTAISLYGLGDELAAISSKNILITAASGNNYFQYSGQMGVSYPAADPAVLAVGAVWSGSFGGPVNYASGAIDYSTGADLLAAFGQRDGELLDVLAPGTRMVGANYNGGSRTMFGTSQASAYMAGIATLAQDLAQDHLGRHLSMAEFGNLLATTSVVVNDGDDENDNVVNTGLDFARVDMLSLANGILAMPVSGAGGGGGGTTTDGNAAAPLAAPGVHHFDLAAAENHTGADFGNFAIGSISGTVFHDQNTNTNQDPADSGLGGWTVFLDGDANGQLDFGEHSAVTDGSGLFQFTDVGPGNYRVSLIGQGGWTGTTPNFLQIAMTSGLDTDTDFGVNARPTLDAVGSVAVNEGAVVGFTAAGHDSAGDSTSYSLVGDSHGASLNASTGQFSWTALDGDSSAGFTLRVTDSAGGTADQAFTVTVNNVAPTLSLSGPASITDDQDFVLDLASSDPGQDTLSGWTVHWGDGSSSQLDAAAGALRHRYASPGNFTVQTTATDEDGDTSASTTVNVQAGTLKVTNLAATATGFQVRFNRAFAPGEINLYDSSFYNRGAADLVFKDGAGRTVAGSAVLDQNFQGLTFVKTNGLLANGNYTIRLDSRVDAFKDSLGGLLDGNRDGIAGGNFTGGFTVNSSGAVMSIGEFSRGPGQAVDVPATAAGVPITITGAAGARQIAFTLAYDPSLLNITGVTGGSGMPVGSTVSADFSTSGEVRISLQLGSALGAGSIDLVKLVAKVPGSAPYGAKQVLDLRNILLDTGAAVRDDDGLHLVAYVGDASGNAKYSTLDVQRIQRTVVRLDNGFGAYPLVDPTVVADINGNAALTALDAQRMLSEVMGLDRPEIPPIPKGMTLTFSGPDPVVRAASVSAQAGDTVVVPITLDTAVGLESVEITLVYPADNLELLAVRLGGLTQDFQYFVKDTSVAGRITIDMARMQAMAGGAGTLVELEFRVKAGAAGSLAIDLLSTALNETHLTLDVESAPGLDPTDGMVTVPAPVAVVVAPVEPVTAASPAKPASAPPVPASTPTVAANTPPLPQATVTTIASAVVQVKPAPVVVSSAFEQVPDATPAAGNAPARALPTFSVAPLLPAINFSQPPASIDLGQAKLNNWVRDWLNPARDKAAALKLNNWKMSLPGAKVGAR